MMIKRWKIIDTVFFKNGVISIMEIMPADCLLGHKIGGNIRILTSYLYGWGGQSWTKMFCLQCIGPHVFLKLLLGLKSTCWCVFACWLTIYSVQTSFFLGVSSWRQWNEPHVLLVYTATSRSHSAVMDGCRVARFQWGKTWTSTRKTHDIEKTFEFKSSKYGSRSAKKKNWNSADSQRWICQKANFSQE